MPFTGGYAVTSGIGIAAPLQVVAFFLSSVSTGAPGWDVAIATMHSAPGLGWLALGYVLSSGRLERPVSAPPT